MRRLVSILIGVWFSIVPAWAQDAEAIEDVIGEQLDAFNARDLQTAWGYASPSIKRMFGNPGNFGLMVERGYPMVWDNSEVRFLELRNVNGVDWQKIMIRDQSGGVHILDYQMIETDNGWKINGVQLLPAPDLGA